MLNRVQTVRNYFSKLGLEAEVADIYLALHAEGPQTISQLARTSKVERTKIYRLIDTLLASHLVQVETHHQRGVIKAAPVSNLHLLIAKKEEELRSLQDELDLIEHTLAHNSLSNSAMGVQLYQGQEGYKQVLWRLTSSKSEILMFPQQPIQATVTSTFYGRWVTRLNKQKISIKGIHSEISPPPSSSKPPIATYESRLIAINDLMINCSKYIYDDTVAICLQKDGEMFCVETYAHELAETERSIFKLLWHSGRSA